MGAVRKRYICSKCGKTGHNRQTCGKTVPPTPRRTTRVVSPVPRPARIETNFSSMADLVGETPTRINGNVNIGDNVAPVDGTADLIDEDMVLTWWNLLHGELPSNRWNYSEWEEENKFYRNFADFYRNVSTTVDAPENVWVPILKRLHPVVLRGLASAYRPGDDPHLAFTLFESFGDEGMLLAFTSNQYTPKEIVEVLAQHPNTEVRKSLARNHQNLPEHVLMKLAADENFSVSCELARNATAGQQPKVRNLLTKSPYAAVRTVMAEQETENLWPYIRDPSDGVRKTAMLNPFATAEQIVSVRDNPQEKHELRRLAYTLLDRAYESWAGRG